MKKSNGVRSGDEKIAAMLAKKREKDMTLM
jgi:hypothetical protein